MTYGTIQVRDQNRHQQLKGQLSDVAYSNCHKCDQVQCMMMANGSERYVVVRSTLHILPSQR